MTIYKTIIQVEILAEEPYTCGDLEELHYDITNGEYIGSIIPLGFVEVPDPEVRDELRRMGNDGTWFERPETDFDNIFFERA